MSVNKQVHKVTSWMFFYDGDEIYLTQITEHIVIFINIHCRNINYNLDDKWWLSSLRISVYVI